MSSIFLWAVVRGTAATSYYPLVLYNNAHCHYRFFRILSLKFEIVEGGSATMTGLSGMNYGLLEVTEANVLASNFVNSCFNLVIKSRCVRQTYLRAYHAALSQTHSIQRSAFILYPSAFILDPLGQKTTRLEKRAGRV